MREGAVQVQGPRAGSFVLKEREAPRGKPILIRGTCQTREKCLIDSPRSEHEL